MHFKRLTHLFTVISALFLASCASVFLKTGSDASVVKIDSLAAPEDSLINALVLPYKLSLDSQMNEIIGYSERLIFKSNPEGLLNNLIADIVLNQTNKKNGELKNGIVAHIALLNNGGLRAPLPEGALTTRNIYEIMPFDNEIVILELKGEKVLEMFNFIAACKGLPLAGAVVGIKDDKAGKITINNVPLDLNKNYFITTSDYLANGGDKMSFFSNPVRKISINYLVRDAIIDYIKEQTALKKTIDAKLDNRIYFE
ncbi:MAG: Trifunctional nucleotide phosphoesterase protein YfkN precursor [Bacteroidetes bacterium ADurb.Bin408]|nr:MAG: Trifunctional nucleotide phosphoesterase protein YfkN precursor [Bacteroidetes bacterium ADurb.Bin408]